MSTPTWRARGEPGRRATHGNAPSGPFQRRDERSVTRYHDFDVLRAFAMLLGVLLHATVFLLPSKCFPVQLEYADSIPLAANPYGYMLLAIHGFRMPVFFMLSGFFTAMLWSRRGLPETCKHRLKRVGLPLLASMITILPATHWIFAFAADHSGKELAAHCTAITWQPLAWIGGFYHLWFLWYLLLMVGVFAVIAKLNFQFRSSLWWLAVPLTLASEYFMRDGFGADTPFSVLPSPFIFIYYLAFFLFGVFFHQREFQARRRWTAAMLPALLAFPPGLLFAYPGAFGLDADAAWVNALAAVLQVAYAWLTCFGLLGLFRWIASRERYWTRYMSDASYWIYLGHLPLIIAAQLLVADWPVDPHLKFLLTCLCVPALLLATYQYGVRHTIIGTVLNGPRRRVRPGPAS